MERIIFIGLVVLLIFGPEKVPAIARTLGNLVREFQGALHPPQAEAPEAPKPARGRRALPKKKR